MRPSFLNRVDVLFMVFALCVAGMTFLVNIRDVVAVPMGESYKGGDILTMATFAQALLQPQLYQGDVFLSNPNHMLVQDGLFLRLLMGLGSMVPDMAYAIAMISIPLIFLHLTGFYLLGVVLLEERLAAVLLSLSCFVYVNCGFDGWAYSETPVSRATVAALLPFVLAGFIYWRRQPDKWLFLMVAAGGLIYGHILNGPLLSLALWVGLLAFKPVTWSWARMMFFMGWCGLAALAVQLPKIFTFLNTMDLGEDVSYATLLQIIKYNDNYNWFFRLPIVYKEFALQVLQPTIFPLWLLATVGVLLMMTRRMVEPALGWFFFNVVAVIVLLGGVVPLLEFWGASGNDRYPTFSTLSRNMPLLIPFMLIICFYTVQQLGENWRLPQWGTLAIMGLIWLMWQSAHEGKEWRNAAIQLGCWSKGQLICPPREDNLAGFYQSVREVLPPGRLVLAVGYDYPLRLMAKVPLVFARRDQKYFIQTSKQETVGWYRRSLAMDAIRQIGDPQERLLGWRDFARSLKAEYIVFSRKDWQANQLHEQSLAVAFPTALRKTSEVGVFKVE